jgi:hypothetical protein
MCSASRANVERIAAVVKSPNDIEDTSASPPVISAAIASKSWR